MRQTTPKEISRKISRWASKISKARLGYVSVNPWKFGHPGMCFLNCAKMASIRGGQVVHGWIIWEGPGILEAEHHAVWANPEGRFSDLTPTFDGEEQILFLVDESLKVVSQGTELERTKNIIYPATTKKKITAPWLTEPAYFEITSKVKCEKGSEEIVERLFYGLYS